MTADPAEFRSNPPVPDIPGLLGRLAPCLRIAHHIPGRLRLTLDLDALADLRATLGAADDFVKSLPGVAGIREVRLNAVARSCVIHYDPATIPDDAWPDTLQGRATPAAAVLARLFGERLVAP